MNLLPKRKNGEPFPLKIVAAVIGVVVVLAVILLLQITSRKPTAPSSGLSEGNIFATAMIQMATSKAQGTPMDSSNPLILTAKAVVGTPDAHTPNADAQLTVTAMLAIATQQASTPKP